jgi:hypothetical protein
LTSRNTARTVATKEQGVRQADIEAFVDGRSTPGRSEVADAEPHYEIDCRMLDPRRVALTRAALLRAGIGAGLTLPLLGGILEQTAYAKPSERSRSTVGNGKTIALSLNGFNVYDQQLATGVLQVLAGRSPPSGLASPSSTCSGRARHRPTPPTSASSRSTTRSVAR